MCRQSSVKIRSTHFLRKSVQCQPSSMRTDGRTGMIKLTVASRSCSTNVPTNVTPFCVPQHLNSLVTPMCSGDEWLLCPPNDILWNRDSGNSVTCDLRIQREDREIGLVLEELSNATQACFRILRPRAEATTFSKPKTHFIPVLPYRVG
jgi:hypothetical protein